MKYIIANWKENMNMESLSKWIEKYPRINTQQKVIISPSYIHIPIIYELKEKLGIEIASQDISLKDKGANTGEVGAFQIQDFCKYSIVGHSERKESNDTVKSKATIALEFGIIPIICFENPTDINQRYVKGSILAWEDSNNISVNGTYKEKDINEIITGINSIRNIIEEDTPLIYGGSVNKQNISGLFEIEKLNGVLVGNASLDPIHFADIITIYNK